MKIATLFSSRPVETLVVAAFHERGLDAESHRDAFSLVRSLRSRDIQAIVSEDSGSTVSGLVGAMTLNGVRGVPVIAFGSGQREAIYDNLRHGAADYATVSDGMAGLVGRVTARAQAPARPACQDRVQPGGLALDADTRMLRANGLSVQLGAREFGLAQVLSAQLGCTVGFDSLADTVWGRGRDVSKRTIEQQASHLRGKLETVSTPACSLHLRAVYGVGYRLDCCLAH